MWPTSHIEFNQPTLLCLKWLFGLAQAISLLYTVVGSIPPNYKEFFLFLTFVKYFKNKM